MNIEWDITKARGNFRPVLRYTISLTEFEKNLGMPAVRVASTIPKPPETGWTHCWPEQNERAAWTPEECYALQTPSHKKEKLTERLHLPWREDNEYPEVEASFTALRDAFEQALAQASKSLPMHVTGRLETSLGAKKAVAPAAAAEKILQVVKRQAG